MRSTQSSPTIQRLWLWVNQYFIMQIRQAVSHPKKRITWINPQPTHPNKFSILHYSNTILCWDFIISYIDKHYNCCESTPINEKSLLNPHIYNSNLLKKAQLLAQIQHELQCVHPTQAIKCSLISPTRIYKSKIFLY